MHRERGSAVQSSPAGTVSSIFFKNFTLISVRLSPRIYNYSVFIWINKSIRTSIKSCYSKGTETIKYMESDEVGPSVKNKRPNVGERNSGFRCFRNPNVHCCTIGYHYLYVRQWGMLYTRTSSAPLPMRYASMRCTSTALYFYEENTQAPNQFFHKHFKQKICK